jgi:ABC-type Zn uptake system ZnuABC Zn-binding protein ZnuA
MIATRRHGPIVWSLCLAACLAVLVGGCGAGGPDVTDRSRVVATTNYLADIVRNVAGDRMEVTSLIPEGSDPHSFEPRPEDALVIAESRLVVTDTEGLAPTVDALLEGVAQPGTVILEAAKGLEGRLSEEGDEHGGETDPHFWLDPINVLTYVANIRDALTTLDPEGADAYRVNADAYSARLRELDAWIVGEVAKIPADRRLLVTNHESLGYFTDRYGFTLVGTVFNTMGAEGSPSARQLADLVAAIKASGVPAIFLEIGSNAVLADEVARETGAIVVTDLYVHSVGEDAPTYIDMIRWDVQRIVEVLK